MHPCGLDESSLSIRRIKYTISVASLISPSIQHFFSSKWIIEVSSPFSAHLLCHSTFLSAWVNLLWFRQITRRSTSSSLSMESCRILLDSWSKIQNPVVLHSIATRLLVRRARARFARRVPREDRNLSMEPSARRSLHVFVSGSHESWLIYNYLSVMFMKHHN